MITITQADIETLLCRPLTPCEADNFALNLENVKSQIQDSLCWDPFEAGGVGTRDFDYEPKKSYYPLAPFTNMTALSIVDCDSDEVQDITCDWVAVNQESYFVTTGCAFGLKRCMCNVCTSISCCTSRCQRIRVTADWNSCPMDDLKSIALKMLAQEIKTSDCNDNIESKSIRSMTITYRDNSRIDYLDRYASVFNKWRLCDVDVG